MRARLGRLALLLALLLPAAAGAQEYFVYNASDSEASSSETAVASAPDGSVVVAWVESPDEIWTRRLSGEWSDAILVGTGHEPCVGWGGGQFILAYVSGASLVLRHGDGQSWSSSQTIQGGGNPIAHPDLACPPSGAAQAYVVWQEMDTQVWFSQRVSSVWSAGQLVVSADPFLGEAMPQVAPTLSGAQITPRVYYYDAVSQIRYRQRSGAAWGDPVQVPGGGFGVYMDVAAAPSFLHHLVSNSPPPSCPCNHLSYIEELPGGGWTMIERLDVMISAYNWPQYMSLKLDVEGEPRLFWYQSMHDEQLEPVGEVLLYQVREGGVWTDHSDLLGGHVGRWTGLAIDPQSRPVFVWTEEVEPERDAMLCRYITSAEAPDPVSRPALRLEATRNPARGSLAFTLELPHSAPARLELFDAAGRCVDRLALGTRAAGAQRCSWDLGLASPAPGVYRVRLTSGGRQAVTGLVLVE